MRKPPSPIILVPNLPKIGENQDYWTGGKLEDEYDETKLPGFTSGLNNCYL